MKKLLQALIPILCVLFLCGCEESMEGYVLRTGGTDQVIIDINDTLAKPEMKFDIFKTNEGIPAARIMITQTTPTYSIGTIVSRMDGSGNRPKISDISSGMLCRETTKETLKAEKRTYKYQKKALKREYKLAKRKAKSGTYEALDKTVQDANKIAPVEFTIPIDIENNP